MERQENETENQGSADGTQAAEEMAEWRRNVVEEDKGRHGEEFNGTSFQSRSFAVEWRGSVLVDPEAFLAELRKVIGMDVYFLLGVEGRKSRNDYMVVVRTKEQLRYRDIRRALMFGHGGDVEREVPFTRLQVPQRSSGEGQREFVLEMVRSYEGYPKTYRYKYEEMMREHTKNYARPGRRKHPAVGLNRN